MFKILCNFFVQLKAVGQAGRYAGSKGHANACEASVPNLLSIVYSILLFLFFCTFIFWLLRFKDIIS